MYQYEVFEINLKGPKPTGSHVHVDVNAEFSLCGETTAVKGFYAGNGIYKVRFYPTKTGVCTYTVTGIVQAGGEEEVLPARDGMHGRVKASGTHFTYEDGSPYYLFGTTVYALLHQERELLEQTLSTLERAPFNKIRICVFPKHYLYNENDPNGMLLNGTRKEIGT